MKQFFQDGEGAYSSTRFVMILTTMLFFITWITELVTTGSFRPTWELVSFVSAVVLGKSIQSFSEYGGNATD
ncbi:MAG: hypothetical protein KGZ42_07550 [Melioribacter sp.]|nr:hypothetical protein [Melioribacter sp.]